MTSIISIINNYIKHCEEEMMRYKRNLNGYESEKEFIESRIEDSNIKIRRLDSRIRMLKESVEDMSNNTNNHINDDDYSNGLAVSDGRVSTIILGIDPNINPNAYPKDNGLSNLKTMIADQCVKNIEDSILKGVNEMHKRQPLNLLIK